MVKRKIKIQTILFALLLFCANNMFAQSDNRTSVSGEDAGWDDEENDSIINNVRPLLIESSTSAIYDLTGKKIEMDDITALPAGIYIRNGKKIIVQ